MKATAQTNRVLLVEDDKDVARTVYDGLRVLGFDIVPTGSMSAAIRLISQGQFQAVVLDRALPDGEGLELVAGLRAAGNDVPILMLTARDTVRDRLTGFDRGADDYLGKPFDINELAARLRAIIRRARRGDRHLLRYADLQLDLVTRKAVRPGLEAMLSDREAELLSYLMRHPDEVLAREALLDELWGDEADESSNLVNVYINLLRNKVESPFHRPLIKTVRGIGYMLSDSDVDELR